MNCPDCNVEMIGIYGFSFHDPCAIAFVSENQKMESGGYPEGINLVYCPECGRVRVDIEKESLVK